MQVVADNRMATKSEALLNLFLLQRSSGKSPRLQIVRVHLQVVFAHGKLPTAINE